MVKYATALRLGTAEAEAILKRFTRHNLHHPTYRALSDLGKAIKTIFLCSYLRQEEVRREIQEGLNVVESWNSANGFIFYGKHGEVSTNDVDAQEIAILSMHLLQSCLVSVNTLMMQEVLAEPAWRQRMTEADWRGLTPLFYGHVHPSGLFDLKMISQRTKEALAAKKAQGVVLGKPKGTLQQSIYDKDRERIIALLRLGVSARRISTQHLRYGYPSSLDYYINTRKLRDEAEKLQGNSPPA